MWRVPGPTILLLLLRMKGRRNWRAKDGKTNLALLLDALLLLLLLLLLLFNLLLVLSKKRGIADSGRK